MIDFANRINKKALVLADQAAFSGTNFASTLLAARILSPVDFGIFSSLVLFLYLLISISNSLIIQPLQVSYSGIENKKAYASFCFLAQLAITILLGLITLVVIQTPLELTSGLRQYPFLIMIYVFGMLFHDYHRKAFLAQDRIFQAVVIDTITGIVQLGGLVFLLLSSTNNLEQLVTIMAFSFLPSLLISVLLYAMSFKERGNWASFISMHIQQGKWLLFTSIMQWWANNLFMVASGVFLGAKALGALRLVQSFFGVLNVMLQILENYALPKAASLFKNSREQSKHFLRQISLGGSIIFGIILIILFLFAEQIITLAGGNQYVEFAFLVKGMALLYFVIFLGYPIRMSIRMMLMNRQFLIGYLISFLFSLATFQYLLSAWHLKGAIVGLITNQLLMLLYWQYLLIKKDFVLWK